MAFRGFRETRLRIENQNAESSLPVEFKVARRRAFSCEAVLSLDKCFPQARGRPYFQMHLNHFFYAYRQGNRIKKFCHLNVQLQVRELTALE